jgi:hypothetical protein
MVVLRDGLWIVLDAAEAGPPYLQLINDPSPHLGANTVVSDAGEVFLDGTIDSYSLDVQHSLQTGAEVLWLYGKHYELGGQSQRAGRTRAQATLVRLWRDATTIKGGPGRKATAGLMGAAAVRSYGHPVRCSDASPCPN